MLAAGGLNYETVLRDIGPASENIPSERCGGEARRANLKRKARYITRSVAETFAYWTLNTVSIDDARDILQTFAIVRIKNVVLFLLIVSCTLHAVSHTVSYDILYIID